ncbi:hypothetical protein D3C75_917830 [compost metagenome]
MDHWKVLPTDERYLNLTEEQIHLLWLHWHKKYSIKPKKTTSDQEYSEEEPESYYDPDFDAEWDSMSGEEGKGKDWEEVD